MREHVTQLGPEFPLLAIGLDNGDEYGREGGLTLLECGTGHRVDFTDPAWGIEPVSLVTPAEIKDELARMHSDA